MNGNITFSVPGCANMLELKENGEFWVKGKLVINDMEIYNTLKEFLEKSDIKSLVGGDIPLVESSRSDDGGDVKIDAGKDTVWYSSSDKSIKLKREDK